jgi:hypothetical protein
VFGLLAVAVAIVIVSALGYEIYIGLESSAFVGAFERAAGSEAEQRLQVTQEVTLIYESQVLFGEVVGGEGSVSPQALPAYQAILARAKAEKLSAYKVGDVTKISLGAWRVPLTETTSRGTHEVVFTVTLRVLFQPSEEGGYTYGPDWEIYEIAGEGLTALP